MDLIFSTHAQVFFPSEVSVHIRDTCSLMLITLFKIKMETNIVERSAQQQYSFFVKKSIISKLCVMKKKNNQKTTNQNKCCIRK